MVKKIKGEKYDGPSGIAHESQWLHSDDLIQGREQKVKIEAVHKYTDVEFKGGRGGDQIHAIVLALKFVGKEKELGLNRTNTKILNKMFTSRTGAWVGKEVTLYVTQTMCFGEMVDCLRIRDTGSRAATAAEEFLSQATEEPSIAGKADAGDTDSGSIFGG